jgi:hypothetical protein
MKELLAQITMQAGIALVIAKPAVDLMLTGVRPPRWVPPLLSYLVALIVMGLFAVAGGEVITSQKIASICLASVLVAVGCVAVTETQERRKASIGSRARSAPTAPRRPIGFETEA